MDGWGFLLHRGIQTLLLQELFDSRNMQFYLSKKPP